MPVAGRSLSRSVAARRRCRSGPRPWSTAKNVRVLAAARELVLLRTRSIGETDLMLPGRQVVLCTPPSRRREAPLTRARSTDSSGSIMGIVNIATTSDGDTCGWRPAQPLPQASARSTEAVAGQENQLGAAVAEEAAPQRGSLRRRRQPSDLQTHRGRGCNAPGAVSPSNN